jgi:ABC-type transport system substrate-binding protein
MTAEDVMANFSRVKNEVSKGWLASAMKQVEGFEAPEKYTFVVKMSKPYAAFLNLISELWIMAPESPGWNETITQPIATGPFKFGEWIPQVKLIAPRNENYWMAGKPYLDGLEFDLREEGDPTLALRAGDLHIARVKGSKIPIIEKDANIELQPMKDTGWYFWSFNNRSPRPPFDNARVREAVTYALDKNAYMNFISKKGSLTTNQMVVPGNFYFDQTLHTADKHKEPNLSKAKQILREEGVDPKQTSLRVVSWATADYAQVTIQMVKKLGFPVEHIALDDLGAMKRLMQFDWDLAPFASGPRADIFLRYVRMMSDGPNPGLWGGVQDPEYDRLCAEAISTVDDQKRRDIYLKAWQRVMDRYYTVVAGHAHGFFGVRKEVNGFQMGYTYSLHRVDGGVAFAWLVNK